MQFYSLTLICCTCHFWSGSPVLSLLRMASACKSLQCLILALIGKGNSRPYSGSLALLCGGEAGTLQTNTTGICGEPLYERKSQGLPKTKVMYNSQIQPLKLLGASWGHSHRWAMYVMHFPGPSYSGSVLFLACCPRLAICLLHFPGPSCSDSRVFYEGSVLSELYMSHSCQAQPV